MRRWLVNLWRLITRHNPEQRADMDAQDRDVNRGGW